MSSNKPQTTTPTTTAQPLNDAAKAPFGPRLAAGFWLMAGDPKAAAWFLEGEQGGQGK